MKKLLTFLALGFLLILALPTPALAHDPGGMAAALIGIHELSLILLIAVVVSLFLLLFNALGTYTATIILIINGIFFAINFLQGFGILDVW